MRKVLSFVLVLSLVLGSVGMAFAAPLSDVAGEDYEDAVNVLTELGVIEGYTDGTYRPDNIVTRAEMAVITVKMLGLDNYASGTSSFKDMAGHWSNKYVAYATSLGIIDGYTDGTFRPDRTVSYDEAAKMLVAMLGYTPDALVGNWPANYVTKAKSLGILDNVIAGSTGANRGDIATMSFQTLPQTIGKVDKDGIWQPTVLKVEKDPVTGVNNYTYEYVLDRLGAELYDGGDEFVVEKRHAEDSVANLMPYIGAWVTAYKNSDGKIIAIKEVKSTFLTGKVISNGKFKAGGVEYSYDSKIVAGTTATAIKNAATSAGGVGVTPSATRTLAVDLSGRTIKEVFSVAEWTVTEDSFFKNRDAADIEEDDALFGVKLPKDDNSEVDVKAFALFGADDLASIPKDSVVYVYALDNDSSKEIVKIEVGSEVVEGKVTRKADDDYTINGKVYTDANKNVTGSIVPKPGDEVKAYLDYSGKVYKFEKISGEPDDYAVVINLDNGSSGLNGQTPKIKLILADGTTKVFTADEKEVANGILAESTKAWTSAVTTGAIVKYGVDKNGLVDEIVTLQAIARVTGTLLDITKKGYFDGAQIADDAVIFTATTVSGLTALADAGTNEDNYGVTSLKDVLDTKSVKARYILDDGIIVAMIVQDDATTDDDIFGVAIDYAENESDAKHEIEFLIDGQAVVYNAKSTAYNEVAVTPGTTHALYMLTFDTQGNVKSLDKAEGKAYAYITASAAVNEAELNGRVVTFTTEPAVTGGGSANGTTYKAITLDEDVVIYKWSAADKAYKEGNLRDIEAAGVDLVFFDTVDEDLVYDIVLVN